MKWTLLKVTPYKVAYYNCLNSGFKQLCLRFIVLKLLMWFVMYDSMWKNNLILELPWIDSFLQNSNLKWLQLGHY